MSGEEVRVPPQNIEAEKSVIGSMLISSEAIGLVIEILKEEWFYDKSHQIIFQTILELYNENQNIDLITVTNKLKDKKKIDQIGGVSYISSIIEVCSDSR